MIKTRSILLSAIVASLAGFLFGFDTIVISGADRPIQQIWETSDLFHGTFIMSMGLWGTVIGALLFKDGSYYEYKGFSVKAKDKDTVGAGNAFLAALLQGLQDKKDINEILTFANAVGAYVATFLGGGQKINPDNPFSSYS